MEFFESKFTDMQFLSFKLIDIQFLQSRLMGYWTSPTRNRRYLISSGQGCLHLVPRFNIYRYQVSWVSEQHASYYPDSNILRAIDTNFLDRRVSHYVRFLFIIFVLVSYLPVCSPCIVPLQPGLLKSFTTRENHEIPDCRFISVSELMEGCQCFITHPRQFPGVHSPEDGRVCKILETVSRALDCGEPWQKNVTGDWKRFQVLQLIRIDAGEN